jgi:outer membrane protein
LRNTEQGILFDGVVAFMDVIQFRSELELRRSNVAFLSEQVRAAGERLEVGEGTRTDVAQADAALAAATAAVSLAQANLAAAVGTYQQVIGHAPRNLSGAKPVGKLLPKSLEVAIAASRSDHPAILAAVHNADVAAFNVEIIEGELLPTVSVEATVRQDWEDGFGARTGNGASIIGRLNIPIYEGGQTYSRVREAKETLGQAKIQVDVARDQVNAALIGAWGGLEGARAQITSARAQISALDLALQGVIEEQRVGQRTTLDVLNAQSDVVEARITQVRAERDVVVAGYAILSAMGRLSRDNLGLAAAKYEPEHHYKQVRDKWIGLRTPDGR